MALVLIGFMGAGKSPAAAEPPRRSEDGPSTRRADRHASDTRSRVSSSPTARPPSVRASSSSSASCWRTPAREMRSRSAAAASSRSPSAPRSPTPRVAARRRPGVAWERVSVLADGRGRPLARDCNAFAAARRASSALRNAGRCPAAVGSAASGDYPVVIGRGLFHPAGAPPPRSGSWGPGAPAVEKEGPGRTSPGALSV